MNTLRLALPGAALSGVLLVTGVAPAVAAPSAPAGTVTTQATPTVTKAQKIKKLASLSGNSGASRDRWHAALTQHLQGKAAIKKYRFDWGTDYCSGAPEKIAGGYNFTFSCYRHDFGYRNYKKTVGKKAFKKSHKARIDKAFYTDMKSACGAKFWADPYTPSQRKKLKAACLKTAKKYYEAVVAVG